MGLRSSNWRNYGSFKWISKNKSKKVRYIGCSALFGYQLLKANMIARKNGWAEFISIQNHYNIIYREDERDLI